VLGSDVSGNAVGDAGARENHPSIARELANLRPRRVLGRSQRREDHDLGSEPPSRVDDRLDRCVGAEKGDAPAAIAKCKREHDEPKIVLFSRRSCEQSMPPRAPTPPTPKCKETSTQEVAREVLLRHGDLSALPPFAELTEDRQHHLAEKRLETEGPEQPVEGSLGVDLVEARK